jgi:BASS family bile acid:Na+ symporter
MIRWNLNKNTAGRGFTIVELLIVVVVIAILVIVSLAIGHFLGGPDDDKRSVLAIACIARNVGLALFIAVLNDMQEKVFPTLVAYLMIGSCLGIFYSIWNKRQLQKETNI